MTFSHIDDALAAKRIDDVARIDDVPRIDDAAQPGSRRRALAWRPAIRIAARLRSKSQPRIPPRSMRATIDSLVKQPDANKRHCPVRPGKKGVHVFCF
jgi:hypothetical protein